MPFVVTTASNRKLLFESPIQAFALIVLDDETSGSTWSTLWIKSECWLDFFAR